MLNVKPLLKKTSYYIKPFFITKNALIQIASKPKSSQHKLAVEKYYFYAKNSSSFLLLSARELQEVLQALHHYTTLNLKIKIKIKIYDIPYYLLVISPKCKTPLEPWLSSYCDCCSQNPNSTISLLCAPMASRCRSFSKSAFSFLKSTVNKPTVKPRSMSSLPTTRPSLTLSR